MAVLLLLVACGPKTRWDHTPTEQHIVRTGETLFTIGWRYGEDPRDLARWNKIKDASRIYPGQVILLTTAGRRAQVFVVIGVQTKNYTSAANDTDAAGATLELAGHRQSFGGIRQASRHRYRHFDRW